MSTTVSQLVIEALADHDSPGPGGSSATEERIEWVGVRHEEAAAFAVSVQSQLTGRLGVRMGTVGPG